VGLAVWQLLGGRLGDWWGFNWRFGEGWKFNLLFFFGEVLGRGMKGFGSFEVFVMELKFPLTNIHPNKYFKSHLSEIHYYSTPFLHLIKNLLSLLKYLQLNINQNKISSNQPHHYQQLSIKLHQSQIT
jgi:hypothetical protein